MDSPDRVVITFGSNSKRKTSNFHMHDFESQVFQAEKCSTVKFSFKALIIPKTQLMGFSCVVGSLANKYFQPIKT